MEGMPERGASGRLIIGPTHLSRADLAFNYDVVGQAIQWMGTRPGIEALTDSVQDFFHTSRCRGRAPTTRHLVLIYMLMRSTCMYTTSHDQLHAYLRRVLQDCSLACSQFDYDVL